MERTTHEPVLVAYASRHGSTRGVAERIGAALAGQGFAVDVLPVEQAVDLQRYEAVVLGSPVYNQRWLPEAEAWLRAGRSVLAGRPVWLFSVGSFGDRRRIFGALVRREPSNVGELRDAVRSRGYRVFAGVVERHQWPLPARIFFHAFGGRFGDSRDWQAIDAWGQGIAEALAASRDAERGSRPLSEEL
jgi:menaquinone-dependent protoporphyrinogen oxidase